ncbi:MAG: type IV pilus modification protein PilV [Betaproteobacteria bacterium]|nr:type IV pilus modification protein PilV [Betaproteobacteria bacterium]
MNEMRHSLQAQSGFTMIEVLVALLIIVLGLLGLAGLQTRLQQAEFESYQRAQAVVVLYNMVDRITINRETARLVPSCLAITDPLTGTPFYGTNSTPLPPCDTGTSQPQAVADATMDDLDRQLKGAAETKGGVQVGAIADARGCVSYDAAGEVINPGTGLPLPGTGVYTVSVAWQGLSDTVVPAVNCGKDLYGAETRRRVISTTFRMASLP